MFSRAFDIFERDVSGLQRLVHKTNDTREFIFTGTPDRLSFVTLEPPYPTSPGPYYIQYSVERNGPQFNLIRARAPYQTNMYLFPGATPANSVDLIQGSFKYKFSYALRTRKGDKWLSAWRAQNRVPDIIRLDVVDARSNVPIAPPFLAAVQTDAELSCLSQSSDTCTARTNGKLVRDESLTATADGSTR
jgi:general secretion pathway protein J